MDPVLKCVLHTVTDLYGNVKGDTEGRIKIFTKETLQICLEKKEIRDQIRKRKSKYDIIFLPQEIDSTSGYHAECYRYFCSSVRLRPQETNILRRLYFKNIFYIYMHFS